MKIINKTKNAVLAEEVIFANTALKRLSGLLGKKEFKAGQALIISPCNSIHTFFMQITIDAVFLNKNNQVVRAISYLKPYQLTKVYFNASYVIELPAGTIQATQTTPNDFLEII